MRASDILGHDPLAFAKSSRGPMGTHRDSLRLTATRNRGSGNSAELRCIQSATYCGYLRRDLAF
jgi:hypothetical protein